MSNYNSADYKMWFMVNPEYCPTSFAQDPSGFDFKTGLKTNLHSKHEYQQGLPIRVEYYDDYDGDETYGNLIIDRTDEYTFKPNGDPMTRTRLFRWVDVTGEFGIHTKGEIKKYNAITSRRAGAKRRENIVDNLIDQAELFGASAQFEVMFRYIDKDVVAFEKTGDKTLLSSIETYEVGTPEGAWLESIVPGTSTTLRQAIIEQLTI